MSAMDEAVQANEAYAAGFADGGLAAAPRRRLAVVTCMDARLDPLRFLGLEPGDAHVIRNAGGIVNDEALRSLAVSHHLLGTREALVVGHTDCGMTSFSNEELHERLGPAAHGVDFQPFADVAARVRESVEAIRSTPLLPDAFAARGFVFDVETGRLAPA